MAVTLSTGPRRVVKIPGVYAPQHDTHLLMQAVRREGIGPDRDVLELGTGSGALAVYAARLGARVTAVDVSRRAVLCARLNAAIARSHVTVRRRDLSLLGSLGGRRYDVVLSNPPYVPAPAAVPPVRGAARAWDGGRDGRAVVDRVCATAGSVLRPGGVLLMVHSRLCGTDATLEALAREGLHGTVSDRETVPFGPVLRSRTSWLRGQGLIDDGQKEEELVVIRARQL